MSKIEIFSEQTIANNKYPLKEISFEKPGRAGKRVEQLHEVYYRPDAVAVLLVNHIHQKMLFTSQFRIASYMNGNPSGNLLEVCAGLIDDGESPEAAALREAAEETGYQVKNLHKVGAVYPSAGGVTEYLHLFIGEYDSTGDHESGGGLEEEGEHIELIEMTFEDVHEKLMNADFNDAKTLLLVQHFFLLEQKSI